MSAAGQTDLGAGGNTLVKLSEISTLPGHWFAPSALRSISAQIASYMNGRGVAGVFVEPDATDVGRAEMTAAIRSPVVVHFIVHVAIVRQQRTIEVGEYYPGEDASGNGKINNAFDSSILEHSPVQPTVKDVMQTGDVDDYLLWLNRQPARQVSAAVDSAEGPDSVSLDYMIDRSKPWAAYAQVSNTGTKETNQWLERVGLIDYQLTGNDDTLSVDYSTAAFDQENSVNVSYTKPTLFDLPRTTGRLYFGYDSFTASDLGDSVLSFTGQTLSVGGEVTQNVFQDHALFFDVIAGMRYEGIHVDNSTLDQDGRGNFFMPYYDLHLERSVQIDTITADLTTLGSLSDTNQTTRDALGRVAAAQDAVILQGDYEYSLFLEPLFDPHGFQSGRSTLANEFAFSLKGQYSFNQRLIAEQEYTEGGLYTVRGYPQSVTAGDSAWVASAEYRLHIPRVFAVQPRADNVFGEPFRWAPQQTYGKPDWDLMFRAFVDAGQTYNANREDFETNGTLLGIGVGLEAQFRDNADIRVDVGRAVNPVVDSQTGQVLEGRGGTQVNVVVTVKM
jgi:hemolysin activation/secretion protein